MGASSYELIFSNHLPRPNHSQLDAPMRSKPLCLGKILVEFLCLRCILGDQCFAVIHVLLILVVVYYFSDLTLALLDQVSCLRCITFLEYHLTSLQCYWFERVKDFGQNSFSHIGKLFDISQKIDFLVYIFLINTFLNPLIRRLCERREICVFSGHHGIWPHIVLSLRHQYPLAPENIISMQSFNHHLSFIHSKSGKHAGGVL